MFGFNRNILSFFDFTLPLLVTPLILLSWFLINENNEFLGNKVLIYTFIGLLIFIVVFFDSYTAYDLGDYWVLLD